ncbi:juvenile hormone acid O-methyltransferase isoform X2 [Episyrphus balteatus]|uniref:juvenile hormone acid O-methyltransferase isoform X2 n=1 Tax=Episyrphus balteatus TaxID=286459 RepID=UPI00248530D7|nr:juvenile hormone acid O-methyltransferase isoform X2 [Episyrphus balteatus]
MNQAKLYLRANNVQRHDAQQIIQEFSNVFQWRLDGKDSLLDVGSGSGDVLMDFLYPVVPKDFKKIVASDISSKMVRHGKKTYSHIDNVDFKVLDIGTETLPKEFINEFDHVTSFYCLHWVQNQRQAIENIYQVLKHDGDCLLVFLATNPIFDIYNIVSLNPKWAPYMKDVTSFISPLHCSKDPETEFSQMLEDAGFVDISVESRDKIFAYEGLDNIKQNVRAVNPFIERIPLWLHEEFLDDIVKTSIGLNLKETNNDEFKLITPYKLIVAYARK